mmetsp:Transcript_106315/g.307955  ORF Transcript_106315/g.307955 Transcript_106315/m.307955 type:complete len:475 (-) Transcript_106315:203-1627(-)
MKSSGVSALSVSIDATTPHPNDCAFPIMETAPDTVRPFAMVSSSVFTVCSSWYRSISASVLHVALPTSCRKQAGSLPTVAVFLTVGSSSASPGSSPSTASASLASRSLARAISASSRSLNCMNEGESFWWNGSSSERTLNLTSHSMYISVRSSPVLSDRLPPLTHLATSYVISPASSSFASFASASSSPSASPSPSPSTIFPEHISSPSITEASQPISFAASITTRMASSPDSIGGASPPVLPTLVYLWPEFSSVPTRPAWMFTPISSASSNVPASTGVTVTDFRWSGLDAASAPLITLKTGTGMHGSETFPSCAMYSWSSRSLCLAAARQHAMETASTTFAGGVGSSCISASIDGWFSSLPTSLSEISFSTESTDLSSPFPPNRCVSLSYGPIVVMAENVPWIVSTVTSRAGVPEAFRASRAVTPRIELTCALSTCSDVLICTKGLRGGQRGEVAWVSVVLCRRRSAEGAPRT